MKKLNSIVASSTITALLSIPVLSEQDVVSEQDDDACCDGELVDIPIQGSNRHLQLVKEALPDLHLTVTSADWESKDGLVQLQTIVKPTMNALGMKTEKIDKLMARIKRYESTVPLDSKRNIQLIFGSVADSLFNNFSYIEREKKAVDIFYNAYSLIYSDTYPDAVEKYKECLEQSVQMKTTRTKVVFKDWVDSIEEESSNPDIFMALVETHQEILKELIGIHGQVPTDERVCHADHLEPAQDLMFGDER